MNETWLKIKAWTKGIIAALLAAYLVLFIYNNTGRPVPFWYWFNHTPEVSSLFLALVAFLTGALFTVLASTTFRTLRQVRTLQANRRIEKLERDQAAVQQREMELRAKAALLKQQQAALPKVVAETE